ncbi:hypothetical protein LUZ63_016946 [Rhynchospora breviuscula]|uniref:NAC domain-containing protein n=1 Tax=Rhynchospora breviuscula TaxID=2022672 RepID=A0A9Q0HEM4_9POAL|nr:hypothetical protein LUZ63_016946 [Rhynchospora breviuscula]
MEKREVIKLPPGFRFHPTDEELVVQYLRRKALSYPLPAAVIPEIDLLKFNPWDLPGGFGEDKYFFNLNEAKYMSGSRSNRATSQGYWKATGKEKQILTANSRGNQVVVGLKKVLVFYQGRPPRGARTDWVMHEYRLACVAPTDCKHSTSINSIAATNGWVLCRISKKKRASKMDVEAEDEQEPEPEMEAGARNHTFIDFFGRRENSNVNTSQSISSDSCVTEAFEELSKGEETTSRGFSPYCRENERP